MASTTSLTVTPAADLTALMRSNDQDCAATRRAPPIRTLNIVRGARKGRVSCCSSSAARASFSVDGANANADPAVRPACSIKEGRLPDVLCSRGARLQGTRSSSSDGSEAKARCSNRIAETPSMREWWNFV
jgi:hypothetical protein